MAVERALPKEERSKIDGFYNRGPTLAFTYSQGEPEEKEFLCFGL